MKDECSSPTGYKTTRDSFSFRLVSIFINRKYVSFLYIKRNHMLNLLSCLVSFRVRAATCGGNFFLLCHETVVVPSLVRINIDSFGDIICYNLVTGNQMSQKLLFTLFSRNENLAKLRVHFKLRVGNP